MWLEQLTGYEKFEDEKIDNCKENFESEKYDSNK